jgi:RNA polymerase sigma factor (sigma-70 family)
VTDDVRAAARGDVQAYERLVRAHAARVVAATLAVTGDPGLAEDAAQDAFVLGWRRLSGLAEPAAFGAWIRQIARNRARDLGRTAARRERRAPAAEDGAPPRTPEDELAAAEDRSRVRDALAALPEEARELLIRHYRDEEPTPSLAAELGLTEAAVRQRLKRARDQLRDELAPLSQALRRTAPGAAFLLAVLASVRAAPAEAAPPVRTVRWGAAIGAGTVVVALLGWLAAPSPGLPPPAASPATASAVEGRPGDPARTAPPTAGAPTAVDEAYAALARVTGGTVVRCPATSLPARPDGPPQLRVVDGEAWFVAEASAGQALVWPALSLRRVTLPEGGAAVTAPDADPGPSLVRWGPTGCVAERPEPVRFQARAPSAVVAVAADDAHCLVTSATRDGAWEVTGYTRVGCRLTTADGAWSAWVPEPTAGAVVTLVEGPPTESVEVAIADVLADAVVEGFGPDDVVARALATPGLSAEAADHLAAWQEAEGAATEELLRLFDGLEPGCAAP